MNNQKSNECTEIVDGMVPMWANSPEKECILEVSRAFEPYKETVRHLQFNNFLEHERDMLNAVATINEVTTRLIESVSAITNSFAKALSGLKIKIPQISEETKKHLKFMEIASEVGFPIFFETNTKLQDDLILMSGDLLEEHYPKAEMKQRIFDYFDCDKLREMLAMWYEQEWITFERKKALREAVEVYSEDRYYSTGSIMMCQLGGLINDLFDEAQVTNLMTIDERKNINALYNVTKLDSEKARVLQMMSIQDGGILQWYKSADYLMNHTYSSTEDITRFEHDPGRHKICHGAQTNYGTKEHALKAILVVDIVIQLGDQMLHQEENA